MERTMVEGTSAQMLGATDISRYPAKNSTNDAAHARNRCGFLHPDMSSARLCTAPSCAQQQQHLKVHPRNQYRLSESLLEAGWQCLTFPDAHGSRDPINIHVCKAIRDESREQERFKYAQLVAQSKVPMMPHDSSDERRQHLQEGVSTWGV